MAKNANVAATPPEDGREVPESAERVAFVLRQNGSLDADDITGDDVDLRFEDANGRDTGCDISIVEYAEKAADLIDQHERILDAERGVLLSQCRDWRVKFMKMEAEKDAEIARLKSDNEKRATMDRWCMEQRRLREKAEEAFKFERDCREEVETELNELRALVGAQPARQVGGDEREQFIAWAVESFPDVYTREAAEHYWGKDHVSALAWQARAALAPAAVVMPDIEALRRWLVTNWMGETRSAEMVWQAAMDEVARLNSRAIPVELLERCLEQMESDWLQIDGEWGADQSRT